jgi:hypothetical protein
MHVAAGAAPPQAVSREPSVDTYGDEDYDDDDADGTHGLVSGMGRCS